MARTVADISMLNTIFSECNTTQVDVSLAGMRFGYAVDFWTDLGPEVNFCLALHRSSITYFNVIPYY